VCVIELGQFFFSCEGGSLVSPDFVRDEGSLQPRAAAGEAAVQYLTASGAAMDAGTIWSGPPVPAGAGSSAETSEEGVSVANDLTALAPHPAATGPDRPPVTFRPGVTSVSAGFFSWDMIANEVMCEPGTYGLHGLPEGGPATMEAFLARVPEEDRAELVTALRDMMTACGTYQIEYRVTGLDGSLRSVEARGRVVPGPDGRPAMLTGFVMDTTTIWASREAERRRLHDGAERTSLTQKFTAALAAAVTVDAITAAAQTGLATYGANSLVILTGQGGDSTPVTSYGFEPEAARLLGDPAPSPGSPVADAIARQSAVFIASAGDLASCYPHLAAATAGPAQRAWAAVPVPDAKGNVGACLMGFAEPRQFAAEERALLVAASALVAQSLQRARMYESEHALARDLQRGLLPRGPLVAPGVTIAARYLPVTSGLEIGGDFYDAIELTDGRVALVIGDVQGHNPIAASLMGRLRMVVHAYAREGHGPAEVMTRANEWLTELNADPDMALFATCCFVVIDPASGEFEMCRAGHPAPVLVSPGGTPVLLDQGEDLLLGVDPMERYTTVKVSLPAGTTLLLTTDGLLEDDGRDPDGNLRALLSTLEDGAGDDLETLADRLLASPQRLARHGDDIALMVARVDAPARPRLRAVPGLYVPLQRYAQRLG
jgi:serine phosphatase RsbU (regulator of sigma subunit)